MIPKLVHYCWFGNKKMPDLNLACIETWEKYLADYDFIRWDERNSPLDNPYVAYHYKRKNWAFVSDFVRLYAIYNYGGIYMDVDFEIIKPLEAVRMSKCFLGEEEPGRITNGICGGEKGHIFFKNAMQLMLKRHMQRLPFMTSPEICMHVYAELMKHGNADDIVVYPENVFYPYNPFSKNPRKRVFLASSISDETLAIHHWAYSWKQPLIKRITRKIFKEIFTYREKLKTSKPL